MPLKSDSQWMLWAVPNPAPSLLCSPLLRSTASSTPRPSWSCTGAPTTAPRAPTTSRCWCSGTSSTCSWWAPFLLSLPLALPGRSPDPRASLPGAGDVSLPRAPLGLRGGEDDPGQPAAPAAPPLRAHREDVRRHQVGIALRLARPGHGNASQSLLLSPCHAKSWLKGRALPFFCWRKPEI